jgi:hypothetical protein
MWKHFVIFWRIKDFENFTISMKNTREKKRVVNNIKNILTSY